MVITSVSSSMGEGRGGGRERRSQGGREGENPILTDRRGNGSGSWTP